MTKQGHSIDGFVPRRAGSRLGSLHPQEARPRRGGATEPNRVREIHTAKTQAAHGFSSRGKSVSRSEIDDSLRQIDSGAKTPKRDRKKLRTPEQRARRRKLIKRAVLALIVLIVCVLGYVGVKAMMAGGNVLQGGFGGLFQNQPLQKDANGRSNIIIFGTAEDDENGEHGGANLTDSLMVLSVDQEKKDAYMLSLPRDLWVKYDTSCTAGYQGKINAVYMCASNDGEDEKAGAAALQKKIGEVTGLDIQYYVHLNFTAVVQAVDAVGGVEVKIESNPKGVGILDRNFDWKCNYKCHYVKYKDGQVAKLDGEHALALARARNASGGYGLQQGNFDREKNQQKIIVALQQKALSAGTLTNIGAITGLIDALGNNLRTNFQTSEIRTLADLAQNVSKDKIESLTLVEEGNLLVDNGMISGQSVVVPTAGNMNYSAIQAYVRESVSSDPVTKEKAGIVVLNGSGVAGAAQTEADRLEDMGFVITAIDNAPAGEYGKATLYRVGEPGQKPATASKLKEVYGGKEFSSEAAPVYTGEGVYFVVVVGEAPATTNTRAR